MTSIFLGVNIGKMNLGRIGWCLMIGWSVWSFILPIIIEIITVDIENLNESKAYEIDENDPKRDEIIDNNLKKFRGKVINFILTKSLSIINI